MLTQKKKAYIHQCKKNNEAFRKKIFLPLDDKEDLKMCTNLYNMFYKAKDEQSLK